MFMKQIRRGALHADQDVLAMLSLALYSKDGNVGLRR
jgi:hypothetical protein